MVKKKSSFFLVQFISVLTTVAYTQPPATQNGTASGFSEGIIYSRTTFPGHVFHDSLKNLGFELNDLLQKHSIVEKLKKYQQSIQQDNEQSIKDAFFISGLMILPMYSKMYYSPSKIFIHSDAIGYHQKFMMDKNDQSGKFQLTDYGRSNQGTIHFKLAQMPEVWQKYQIDAAQYSMQKTNETQVIAGYKCKKVIYSFNGTSRGSGVSNYIINLLPLKITAWYSDDLPASINIIHPLAFEEAKAVLKFEVEYDKNHKNKMLVEITGMNAQKLDDNVFVLMDTQPVVQHQTGQFESGMLIMQVMMNAIGQLTK